MIFRDEQGNEWEEAYTNRGHTTIRRREPVKQGNAARQSVTQRIINLFVDGWQNPKCRDSVAVADIILTACNQEIAAATGSLSAGIAEILAEKDERMDKLEARIAALELSDERKLCRRHSWHYVNDKLFCAQCGKKYVYSARRPQRGATK